MRETSPQHFESLRAETNQPPSREEVLAAGNHEHYLELQVIEDNDPQVNMVRHILENEEELRIFLQDPTTISDETIGRLLTATGAEKNAIQFLTKWFRRLDGRAFFGRTFVRDNKIMDILHQYAQEYFNIRHGIPLLQEGKKIFQTLAPDQFIDYDIKFAHADTLAIHHSRGTEKDVLWVNFDLSREHRKPEQRHTEQDLIAVMHEYAHGMFDRIIDPEWEAKEEYFEANSSGKMLSSVYGSLTEGFATFTEMLATKAIATDPTKFNFTAEQADRMDKVLKERIGYLHDIFHRSKSADEKTQRQGKREMAYTEGTIKIMHTIYTEKGLPGVIEFLKKIDPKKALQIDRDDPTYQVAIKRNTPEILLDIIGK